MHQHQLGSTSSQYVYEAQKTRPDAQLTPAFGASGHMTGSSQNFDELQGLPVI
jgi:hypothetical protein